jgi:adenylate cyclase
MWAERYDRDLKEVFAVQDEITRRIITALQVELTEGEEARLHGEATENLEAYLKMLQARHHFYRMNRQGSMQARKLAEEAIQLDQDYASSYVMISLTHMMDLWFNFSDSPEKSMKLATEAAEKALALDDSNPSAYVGLCMLYVMQRRHDEAIAAGKRAIELSPSGATAHMSLGTALSIAGRQEESIAAFETAIRLNPYPHSVYFRGLGNSYRLAGDYERAMAEYRKALQFEPEDLFTRLGLAATYVSLGRKEEAEAEAAEILRIHREFSLEYFAKTLPFKNDKDTRQFVEALRRAGLQ